MSSTLTFPTSGRAGQTIVWHLSNQAGQRWNATLGTPAFENVTSVKLSGGQYNLSTSEVGGSGVSGVFTGTMPATAAAGRYRADAYVSGTYTVPVSDVEWFYWDGTNIDYAGDVSLSADAVEEVAEAVSDLDPAISVEGNSYSGTDL